MCREIFEIGPFLDYPDNPILGPGKGFISKGIYNPTVIKDDGRFLMLFRAEAGDGVTGRIGFAQAHDGLHFTCHPDPVITPGEDFDKFGCEDPRVVKFNDTYFLTYVGNCGGYNTGNICLATSKDLFHWEKHGPILPPREGQWDGGQIKAGAIAPEKINNKYIMYFMGEERPWKTAIGIAYSEDLFHWDEPLDEPIITPRKNFFDCQGVEPGPNPVLVDEGILLVYNGWERDCIYRPGVILFSRNEPTKVVVRSDEPILSPSRDYGKEFGTGNHVVTEGLVIDGNKWLLYYGAADRVTCLAIYDRESK